MLVKSAVSRSHLLTVTVALVVFMALIVSGSTSAREVAVCSTPGRGGVEEQVLENFKRYIAENSGGRFEAVLFMGGVLGSEQECTEALQLGEIQFNYAGVQPIEMILGPGNWPFNIPFLFEDRAQAQRVLDEEFTETISKRLEPHGIKIVGTAMRTPRKLSATRPITHPDEVRGLSMRLPEITEWLTVWRDGLGAKTIALPGSEVFGALQTGLVSAQENPASFTYANRIYEVTRYIMNTDHVLAPRILFVSTAWLESLSPEEQEWVIEAGQRAMKEQFYLETEWEEPIIQRMKDAGVEFIDVDVSLFRERALPAILSLRSLFSAEIWNTYVAPRL